MAAEGSVAVAVPARQVAPGGALPEQIVQLVDPGLVLPEQVPEPPLQAGIHHRQVCKLFLLQFHDDGAVFCRDHLEFDILLMQPVGRAVACPEDEKRRRERRALKQVSEPILHM